MQEGKNMEIISKHEIPGDTKDRATVYDVKLNDGRMVSVERKHFPSLMGSSPMASVVKPCDDDIDEQAVLRELRSICDDFGMASVVRKARLGYKHICDTYYSLEQAIFNADQMWAETKNKSDLDFLYIKKDGKIVKNYKRKFECYVEDVKTGDVSSVGIIEAPDEGEAAAIFYSEHPDYGSEGDTFVAEEVTK